jgi:hypothetical protein
VGTKQDYGLRDNVCSVNAYGKDANPGVAIVITLKDWSSPESAEIAVKERLKQLQDLLSWVSGNSVIPFGYVILGPQKNESYFRLTPTNVIKRTRLGFGNIGDNFLHTVTSLKELAAKDERFKFVLSTFHDANKETNVRFQIARYFTCLESLAHKIKKGQGSRDAIRQLLGLEKGPTGQIVINERKYDYDVVLGAGILRDYLFHGTPLDFDEAKPHERDTFDLISKYPDTIASELRNRVELELVRFTNGTSNGQNPDALDSE